MQHELSRRRVVAERDVAANADQVDVADRVVGNRRKVDRGGSAGGLDQRSSIEHEPALEACAGLSSDPVRDRVRVSSGRLGRRHRRADSS